jgi:NitT/TauT family transport system substrate-binding protein
MGRRLKVHAVVQILLGASIALSALTTASAQSRASKLRIVTLGVGYVPSVQFAPFYVAAAKGYYRQAGLDVRFSYGFSPNLLQLVGAGREDFAIGDGTDTIIAGSEGVPVTSIATMYQRLPVAVFSLQKTGIRSLGDLRGKRLGIPGRFGSSYAALLASLYTHGLKPGDISIQTIGYTQPQSVVQGKVAAAVGYSTNEPIVLERHGYRLNVLEIGTLSHLVGAGLVAGNALIARDPGTVTGFVRATMRGLADTIDHPRAAFAVSRRVRGLNTLRGRDVGDQYAVLLKSVAFWHDATTRVHGLGYGRSAQWTRSIRLLKAVGQLTRAPALARVQTNRFIAGSPDR